MEKRGIVITSPFVLDGTRVTNSRDSITPEILRHYILYWDKIDWPSNNIVESHRITPELDFLIDEGVIQRTHVVFSSYRGNPFNAILEAQERVLKHLNDSEPGCWSLVQAAKELSQPDKSSELISSIDVQLYSAIPVPVPDVPLDDVLYFKMKRRDELLALRSAMDDLYGHIIDSADIPRAKIHAIDTIERRLLDLNRVFSETWDQRLVKSLKVELNIPNLAAQAYVGTEVSKLFGFSPTVGATLGVAAAALKMDFTVRNKVKDLPDKLRDYAYLHWIEKELR
jgi:hypothetical protein